jgi:hypothetical protein
MVISNSNIETISEILPKIHEGIPLPIRKQMKIFPENFSTALGDECQAAKTKMEKDLH